MNKPKRTQYTIALFIILAIIFLFGATPALGKDAVSNRIDADPDTAFDPGSDPSPYGLSGENGAQDMVETDGRPLTYPEKTSWVRLKNKLGFDYADSQYHVFVSGLLDGKDEDMADAGLSREDLEEIFAHNECLIFPREFSHAQTPYICFIKCSYISFGKPVTTRSLREEDEALLERYLSGILEPAYHTSGPEFVSIGDLDYVKYTHFPESSKHYRMFATFLDDYVFSIFFSWQDGYDAEAALFENDVMTSMSYHEVSEENSSVDADEQDPMAETEDAGEGSLQAEVGDTLYFGAYEQDNLSSDGKEEIEWIVLDKNDDSILLISKMALDVQMYNREGLFQKTTWETCKLRTWLNEVFIAAAFSEDEQTRIVPVTVTADRNPKVSFNEPGNDTEDRIFLLSTAEAETYFPSDEARICRPTTYAKAQGGWVNSQGICCWWLRTPGLYNVNAATVYTNGACNYEGEGTTTNDLCIRPAMWIRLSQ